MKNKSKLVAILPDQSFVIFLDEFFYYREGMAQNIIRNLHPSEYKQIFELLPENTVYTNTLSQIFRQLWSNTFLTS